MGKDILSMLPQEIEADFLAMGEQKFRARQVFEWLSRGVRSFDEMTNLSKDLQKKLEEQAGLTVLEPVEVQVSKLDGTRKYLFRLEDGNVIESVLMKYKHGNSVCISSQVGCRMGCRFCASTLDGLVRGLTPGEMLEQIYRIGQDIGQGPASPYRVPVFLGMPDTQFHLAHRRSDSPHLIQTPRHLGMAHTLCLPLKQHPDIRGDLFVHLIPKLPRR